MDAALIIASGRTGRDKALEPLRQAGTLTAEQRLVLLFQRAGLNKIYVVSHREMPELEKSLARLGVSFLYNPQPEAEMIDNVRFALRQMPESLGRILLTPNHVNCYSSETVQKILASEADAAVAAYQGRAGHPLLLSRRLWPAILAFEDEGGLDGALRELGFRPEQVETDDPAVLMSLNETSSGLDQFLRRHEVSRLRPIVRVSLAKDRPFFGPGPQQLLEMVEESDNFREACSKMGISYSKGWKMVEKAEKALGVTLVERSKGGSERGSSKLSEEGRMLLERYRLFRDRADEAVEAIFAEVFADGRIFEKGDGEKV